MILVKVLVFYLILMNLTGFIVMGADKRKAIRGAYRISEASLFAVALLGGALGSTIGMHFFHHKTRHWYFRYGFPLILILEVILFFAIFRALIYYSI